MDRGDRLRRGAAGAAFEEQDRAAARNFGEAARAAAVRKIVYLGGLGEAGADLSSLWLGPTTPVYARFGRKRIEGVSNPTVVRDDSARRLFPAIVPMGLRRSIERALTNEDEAFAATRWPDALSSGATRIGSP